MRRYDHYRSPRLPLYLQVAWWELRYAQRGGTLRVCFDVCEL